MSYYNNSYVQKRGAEKSFKIMGKDIAENEHYKEVRNAINECASQMADRFGLSDKTSKNIASLISNDRDMGAELYKRIFFVVDTLKKYGYTDEEAANIIDDNFSLIQQSSVKLVHNLAIANQYGLDEDLLVNNRLYASINENELYALMENLKETCDELTLEKVSKLNTQVKKDNNMSNLIELYPISHSRVLVYRTLYDRKLQELEGQKTLIKRK